MSFNEDFENGSLLNTGKFGSIVSSGEGTIVALQSTSLYGKYLAEAVAPTSTLAKRAGLQKLGLAASQKFLRGYFIFKTLPNIAAGRVTVMAIYALSGVYLATVTIQGNVVTINYRHQGGVTFYASTFTVEAGKKYEIQLAVKVASAVGANDGAVTAWVNGVAVGDIAGVDNADGGNISEVRAGMVFVDAGLVEQILDMDEVALADSYINPVTPTPTPISANWIVAGILMLGAIVGIWTATSK